jgi:L-ribulose-5-phosphate 4-epimerase
MGKYTDLKERVYIANMQVPAHKLAIFTWGNVSAIDRAAGVMAIKPSGVAYDKLIPADMVVVDLEGKVVDGTLRPSSDTNTHLVLYKAFESVGGIIHTHSTYATAWSQACRSIPIYGTTQADHLAVDIPCTSIMGDDQIKNDYETETGNQIVETFAHLSPEEVEMVLVACHGPFAWGKDESKAVYNGVVLEEIAQMATLTERINPQVSKLKQSLCDKHYFRKHGKNAYYGQK